MSLPTSSTDTYIPDLNSGSVLFIAAEGFEKRSYYWISKCNTSNIFTNAIICKYNPKKTSHFEEIFTEIRDRCVNEPKIFEYNTFTPSTFEFILKDHYDEIYSHNEIVIDISVMSKLLIVIILYFLKNFQGKVSIIYSEPVYWSPTEPEFKIANQNKIDGSYIALSSVGVFDVVRTPMLSSILMQDSPIILITFLSFNEQLIRVLLNSISPSEVILLNTSYERYPWRSDAMLEMHMSVLEDYMKSNQISEAGLSRTFSNTDYVKVFEEIASIYRKECLTKRIILSPTGTKLQAVACSMIKICCPDIHIEYPIPESYTFPGFSSDDVFQVHNIRFDNYGNQLLMISNEYNLNG